MTSVFPVGRSRDPGAGAPTGRPSRGIGPLGRRPDPARRAVGDGREPGTFALSPPVPGRPLPAAATSWPPSGPPAAGRPSREPGPVGRRPGSPGPSHAPRGLGPAGPRPEHATAAVHSPRPPGPTDLPPEPTWAELPAATSAARRAHPRASLAATRSDREERRVQVVRTGDTTTGAATAGAIPPQPHAAPSVIDQVKAGRSSRVASRAAEIVASNDADRTAATMATRLRPRFAGRHHTTWPRSHVGRPPDPAGAAARSASTSARACRARATSPRRGRRGSGRAAW
jgi:hypothetical protein